MKQTMPTAANMPHFQNLLDHWVGLDQFLNIPTFQKPAFPPYDIIRNGNDYKIVMALAGYNQNDLKVTHIEDTLVIESNKQTVGDEITQGTEYLHQGIAKRTFKLSFNLSPEVVIEGSSLRDGLLTINMTRIIPTTKQPKLIPILTES